MEGVEAGGLDSALVVTVPEAEKHREVVADSSSPVGRLRFGEYSGDAVDWQWSIWTMAIFRAPPHRQELSIGRADCHLPAIRRLIEIVPVASVVPERQSSVCSWSSGEPDDAQDPPPVDP